MKAQCDGVLKVLPLATWHMMITHFADDSSNISWIEFSRAVGKVVKDKARADGLEL